jgi:hypothetical protein
MIDGYDIRVYDTLERGGFALEVLDIGAPGIELFTSDGKQLKLAAEGNRVVVKADEYMDRPGRLQELLRAHLRNMDLLVEALLTARTSLNSFGFGFRLQTAPERKR